jgi:hypothetical protein
VINTDHFLVFLAVVGRAAGFGLGVVLGGMRVGVVSVFLKR